MTAPANKPHLTKLRNYDNILTNPFFGQIQDYKENWRDNVGNVYDIIHPDFNGFPMQCQFVGCFLIVGNEIDKDFRFRVTEDNRNNASK